MNILAFIFVAYVTVGFLILTFIYIFSGDRSKLTFLQFCKDLGSWPWRLYKALIRR